MAGLFFLRSHECGSARCTYDAGFEFIEIIAPADASADWPRLVSLLRERYNASIPEIPRRNTLK
jgi:hypothetical protein